MASPTLNSMTMRARVTRRDPTDVEDAYGHPVTSEVVIYPALECRLWPVRSRRDVDVNRTAHVRAWMLSCPADRDIQPEDVIELVSDRGRLPAHVFPEPLRVTSRPMRYRAHQELELEAVG